MSRRSVIVLCLLGLLGVLVASGSWYTVDQGERVVVLRTGAVHSVAGPGLHFKIPLIDTIERFSVQDHAQIYEEMHTYSRDQQPAVLTLSVSYNIQPDNVDEVYTQYGSRDGIISRLLDRVVLEESKNVFGRFNAVTAVQERTRLNAEITEAVANRVQRLGPLLVKGVRVENIDYSDAYEKSIEARMLAEVEVQKIRQNAEREKVQAEIVVINAKAQAEAVRAQAQAEADAIRLRGEAEATAIRAKGEALRDNPGLVSLVQAERWNGTLPTTMVPGTTVPFLNMTQEVAR